MAVADLKTDQNNTEMQRGAPPYVVHWGFIVYDD